MSNRKKELKAFIREHIEPYMTDALFVDFEDALDDALTEAYSEGYHDHMNEDVI